MNYLIDEELDFLEMLYSREEDINTEDESFLFI